MATNRENLKEYFKAGDRPTEAQFIELIDNSVNVDDDKASDSDAASSSIDNKYVTPKTARKVVDSHLKVNGKSPVNGLVTILTSDISGLDTSIGSKQTTLVSGTNIKTINNQTLLGSGNIDIPVPTNITGNAATATKLATPKNINGIAFDGSVDVFVQRTFVLGSNAVSSVVARANVSGLFFSALAGKRYKIEIIGDYQTALVTTGGSLGFVMTSGTATIKGLASMEVSVSSANALGLKNSITAINTTNTTTGSFITSSGVSAVNSPHNLCVNLVLNCATAGNFQVQWASEVAGSVATLNAGTVMIVTQLN